MGLSGNPDQSRPLLTFANGGADGFSCLSDADLESSRRDLGHQPATGSRHVPVELVVVLFVKPDVDPLAPPQVDLVLGVPPAEQEADEEPDPVREPVR